MWARNGLSHLAPDTWEGRLLYGSLHRANVISRAVGGPSLESYLLARHRAIDALVTRAIEQHGVTQLVELASGLPPRGWRLRRRYGDRLTYGLAIITEGLLGYLSADAMTGLWRR